MGFGPVVHGWALGMLGEEERGAEIILEGLGALPPGLPFRALYATMLAELYWREHRIEEALTALDAGFAVVRSTDAHLWEPELSRLRGEIGLERGEVEVDAERWLQRALKVARRQEAKSLELRAAFALFRLKRSGPEALKARERVASIYRAFAEGFETADLIEARKALAAPLNRAVAHTALRYRSESRKLSIASRVASACLWGKR